MSIPALLVIDEQNYKKIKLIIVHKNILFWGKGHYVMSQIWDPCKIP